jgi:predicted nucleotidyltransferase
MSRNMNPINQYLFKLAQRNAVIYSKDPRVKAIALVGSVSRGFANEYSDIDIALYYEDLPSKLELKKAMEHNQGVSWKIFHESKDAIADLYYVDGVECQFGHGKVKSWENRITEVLERHSTDSDAHTAMSGLLDAVPLYGEHLVEKWKSKVSVYPEKLAVEIVKKHLNFPYSLGVLEKRVLERDSVSWFYELLTEIQKNILGVMIGLNKMYLPSEFKRLDWLIGKMSIKPKDFYKRINRIFEVEPNIALNELGKLIQETVELVKTHLPEVETEKIVESFMSKPKPIILPTQ